MKVSSSPGGDASTEAPPHAYRLVSATFQNREYPEGILRVNDKGSEIELRQWTGKKKREETVIARFRLEPNVEVAIDGALLKVSGLSMALESPGAAGEVAELLKRPARELEAVRLVSEAENSVSRFLEAREGALSLLLRVKADPREALYTADSTSVPEGADPLEALYSTFSKRLGENFESMKSSLAGAGEGLGPRTTDTLYAIAYTIGAVQDALFEGHPDLAQELAALQELGIATTAQEIRMEKPTAQLMLRAHPALVASATSQA